MPLTAEQMAEMDAAIGNPQDGNESLFAQMDAALGMQKPKEQSAFQRRMQNVQELKHGEKVDPLIVGPYATGQAIGLAGELVGQGIAAVTPEFIKEPVGRAAQAVGEFISPVTEPIGRAYGEFKQEHPNVAAIAETAGNYSMLYPGAKGAQAATKAVADVPVVSRYIEDVGHAPQKAPKLSKIEKMRQETEALGVQGGKLYKASSDEGVQFSFDEAGKLLKNLNSLEPKTDMERRVWKSSAASKQVNDITESILTEPPNLDGLLAKRSEVNSLINVAYRDGNDAEATKLLKVKERLDDTMRNERTETWQKANHVWAQKSTLQDIDDILFRVEGMAQPANSFDTAFKKWIEKNTRYLSDEELQAAMDVVENTAMDKLRKGAAGGLLKYATTIVGAQGGPMGAGAGYLMGHFGSEYMKDAAMLNKLEKLDRFRDLIVNRQISEPPKSKTILQITDRGQELRDAERAAARRLDIQERLARGQTGGIPVEKPKSGPHVGVYEGAPYNLYKPPAEHGQFPIALLAAPQKEFISNASGVIRQQSEKELMDAVAKRDLYATLGITPDISKEIFKRNMRDKFSEIWDRLDIERRAEIDFQIEKAWKEHKAALDDMIIEGSLKRRGLEQVTTGMEDALKKATRGK